MRTNASSASKHPLIWTLALLACCATVGRIGFDVYRRAGAMRTATAAGASILAAKPGARINAVVRLENAAGSNIYSAEVLESRDGADYHATSMHIRVALASDAALSMGGAADIRPGAVIQLSGTIDGVQTLHANKVVILTGYVRIVPVQS
jgi:hypothetical protein